MKLIKYLILISLLTSVFGCVTKPRVVKSPCVESHFGDNATPCIRRPVNNKWLA